MVSYLHRTSAAEAFVVLPRMQDEIYDQLYELSANYNDLSAEFISCSVPGLQFIPLVISFPATITWLQLHPKV